MTNVRVLEKHGGKSGDWKPRSTSDAVELLLPLNCNRAALLYHSYPAAP
jgi:hypothetical protein